MKLTNVWLVKIFTELDDWGFNLSIHASKESAVKAAEEYVKKYKEDDGYDDPTYVIELFEVQE